MTPILPPTVTQDQTSPTQNPEAPKEEARGLIYWGQVPVEAVIGGTRFTTAIFPRDGRYLLPVKSIVQRAEKVGAGDVVDVVMALRHP